MLLLNFLGGGGGTGGVFLGEPVMEIYPEADTQN
ncbi:unnamed protein product [Brassica oleracea var. botrytis]